MVGSQAVEMIIYIIAASLALIAYLIVTWTIILIIETLILPISLTRKGISVVRKKMGYKESPPSMFRTPYYHIRGKHLYEQQRRQEQEERQQEQQEPLTTPTPTPTTPTPPTPPTPPTSPTPPTPQENEYRIQEIEDQINKLIKEFISIEDQRTKMKAATDLTDYDKHLYKQQKQKLTFIKNAIKKLTLERKQLQQTQQGGQSNDSIENINKFIKSLETPPKKVSDKVLNYMVMGFINPVVSGNNAEELIKISKKISEETVPDINIVFPKAQHYIGEFDVPCKPYLKEDALKTMNDDIKDFKNNLDNLESRSRSIMHPKKNAIIKLKVIKDLLTFTKNVCPDIYKNMHKISVDLAHKYMEINNIRKRDLLKNIKMIVNDLITTYGDIKVIIKDMITKY